MFRVISCLTVEHDRRLLALALVICVLASSVTISLFHRAQATGGRDRLIWLGLCAAAGGCGIWATHFIAMLAYQPDVDAGYDPGLTILSLVFAIDRHRRRPRRCSARRLASGCDRWRSRHRHRYRGDALHGNAGAGVPGTHHMVFGICMGLARACWFVRGCGAADRLGR